MKHMAIIGIANDTMYVAAIETDMGYFSLTGTGYSIETINEEQGERRAREYLEDGELWKMAVANGSTTDSLEDWVDIVLDADGWQSVLGDVEEFLDDQYVFISCCGCLHNIYSEHYIWDKLYISQELIAKLRKAAKMLHLKQLDQFTPADKELMDELIVAFDKTDSDDEHIGKLLEECNLEDD